MIETEVRKLYAVIMAYDNRKLSEANITAWREQAERNRWSFDEARDAVHTHHATSTEFLMPAHITAIIRHQRRQPENLAETRQIESAPPAQPDRIQRVVSELSDRMGWDQQSSQRSNDGPLLVECPHCHAAPQRPCARLATRGTHKGEHIPLSQPHPSRSDLVASMRKES